MSSKLIARLRQIAKNSRDLSDITDRGAELVAAEARRQAPVDSGQLAESIEAVERGNRSVVHVGEDYGGFVEYGTVEQREDQYLRPAVQKAAPAFANIAAQNLEKILAK